MKKPLIGVTMSSQDGDRSRPFVNPDYVAAIERAGGEVRLLDSFAEEKDMEGLDGILFTGGVDVNPARYDCLTEPGCGEIQDWRDESELNIAGWAFVRKLPVMGICRGIQLLNVALGGTLIQHLPDWTSEGHQDGKGCPHRIRIREDSHLYELSGAQWVTVNSYHHQAVAQTAPSLVVTATSEAGYVEALERPGYPYFMAVQWHPERLTGDPFAEALFSDFVNAAKQN